MYIKLRNVILATQCTTFYLALIYLTHQISRTPSNSPLEGGVRGGSPPSKGGLRGVRVSKVCQVY